MKKQMLLAAVAGLTLVSAHPGPPPALEREARSGYPPCSRTVTDRCIQLYERGVRASTNLARNAAPAASPVAVAAAEPAAPRTRPTVRVGGDDIDVAYAGNVLQAPRSAPQPVTVERQRPDAPTRVVVVREQRQAHAVTPQAIAQAAQPPRAQAVHAAAPRVATPAPRRQLSMRVRRAGERG